MSVEVVEEPVASLAEYARIPITFEVGEVFDLVAGADGSVRLNCRRLAVPYVKDYDGMGNGPKGWAGRFDLSNWGFFSALSGGQPVGRAAVAHETPTLELLQDRSDLALLW